MTPSTAPQTNPGTDTPPAMTVLRRRYGRARHVILTATWITVINMLVGPITAMAATYTWDHAAAVNGTKSWSSNLSWSGDVLPTFVAGDTLDLSTVNITGAASCNMDASVGSITLGTITIGDATTSSSAWTLNRSGTQVLILDNGGSAAAINQTATSFGDTISVPLSLLSNLAVDNLSANTLTLAGGISAGSAGLKTITINNTGTGPVTISSGVVSDGTGSVALAHKNGTLTLSGANTYSGGTTLSAGTIIIAASSFPTVGPLIGSATGPLGKGTLTINGASTLRIDSTTGRTIANDFTLNTSGTVTFGASGTTTLTISGQNQSIAGTPTLSFNTVGTTFASYPMALNSSATLSNTGAGAPSFNGGLTVASGGSTITDSMSSTLTIVGPLTLNGNLTLTGTHAGLITMSGITETIVGSGGATLHFNDSAGANGLTTYTTGPLILGGNFTLTGNSTKKPTVTINGLRIANGATSTFNLENNASNITLAALGSDWIIGGTLGLTLTSPATARTIASPLVGAGSFTLNNGSAGVTLSGGGPLFSGTITIGDGVNATTVLLGSNNGLPILANVSLAAGTTTLNIIGYDTQIGSLTGGTTATLTNTGALKTLTVGNANNTTYSGLLTATTPANLLLTKIGSGKLTLNGPVVNTYTSATKIYAGELALDLTNLGSPYQNLISSSSVWTLGGGTVSVKAHASSGAVAVQTLNGTTFAVGASAVSYDNNGASGTSLALAALARSAGSTVKFTLPGSGNITTTSSTFVLNNVLVHAAANGIAYATIGTTDWAGLSGNNILTLTGAGGSYAANDFTANTKNTDVTGSQSPAAFTVNTLRFNSDGAALDLNSSGASTVNTGGILITGNANSSGVTISGSGSASLKPGGGKELVVINYGKLALNAVLADNATSAVTYSGTGTTDLTGNSAGNTYVGLTTLNQGTLKVSANNQLGAVGTGAAIYINGGTLQAGATFALDNSGSFKRGVTVYPAGATFDTGAHTLTISGVIASGLANVGPITKTGSGTLVLSGANTFTGGFNWSAGNLSLGFYTALGGGSPNFVTFASAGGLLDNTTGSALAPGNNPVMFWNADFAMVGNASATATANDIDMGTGAVLLGGNRTITVGQGSNYGKLTVGGVIHDGGMNYSLAKAGAGTLVLSANSTYSGGTTLSAGTLAISASSTGTLSADPSPGVVYGPVGTGTLTLNGGTLRSTAVTTGGDRTIHNALAISGNVTLGDVANNGKLTFMGASQTIAAGSVVTALSAVTFGAGLTIGNGVTFYGPGLVTLQAQTVNNSSSNPIVIGDGTTFSGNGVGGNAAVASQNSLGTAAVTIHYGGTLTISAAFNPSNAFTVNNGGTLNITHATAVVPSNTITLNSGATLSSLAALTLGGNVSFPTAGVVIINLKGAASTANAYPAFTGTLVIGGRGIDTTGSGDLTTSGTTAVSSDRTLAFNHLESGGLFLNGLALDADLTVAGVGLNIPNGSVPWSPSTALTHLGNITTVSGSRNIIIAMSPLGLVSATGSANWNNTTINSGTFEVSTSANNIGSGTVTLNGGTLRLRNGNSSTKAITVAANGGVLDGVNIGGAPGSYSGAVTGASLAPLVIRSGTAATATSEFNLSSANLTGFNGAVILATGYYASPITLGADAVPSGGNAITVPKGIAFGGAAVKSSGLYSNNAKFITDYDSIYVVTTSDTAPNLSNAGGFARDIAVGLNGTALTGYTFPSAGPNTATYRIVLVGATTISAASTFTSGNNLDLSAAANVTDSNSGLYSMYTRTGNGGSSGLTLTSAQDYSGSTKITGGLLSPILRAGATGNTSARLIVGTGGSLTQTSSITIDNNGGNFAAYLELTGTAASPGRLTKANLPITIKGNGYLSIGAGEDPTRADNNGVTDRIASTSDITLGGASGGGNLLLRYPAAGNTHSQTLDALTIDAGMSSIH
jgi:fibronectin-binding autotransporter adhesin